MRLKALFMVLLFPCAGMAQKNLIYDSTFSLTGADSILMWWNPASTTPDLYGSRHNYNLATCTEIKPLLGTAFLHLSFSNDNHEYFETMMGSGLEEGQLYCVSMSVSRHSNPTSHAYLKEIGVRFSKGKMKIRDYDYARQFKFLPLSNGDLLNSKGTWVKICGVYKAEGNERYLTIGSFEDLVYYNGYGNVDNDSGEKNVSYYIDHVSVKKIEDELDCECYMELNKTFNLTPLER